MVKTIFLTSTKCAYLKARHGSDYGFLEHFHIAHKHVVTDGERESNESYTPNIHDGGQNFKEKGNFLEEKGGIDQAANQDVEKNEAKMENLNLNPKVFRLKFKKGYPQRVLPKALL